MISIVMDYNAVFPSRYQELQISKFQNFEAGIVNPRVTHLKRSTVRDCAIWNPIKQPR